METPPFPDLFQEAQALFTELCAEFAAYGIEVSPALESALEMTRASHAHDLGFTGTGVSWISVRGPFVGIANVYVDGARVAVVDGYAPTTETQAVLFTSAALAYGSHTLAIETTRTRNDASSDFTVVVDAFEVTGAPLDTEGPVVVGLVELDMTVDHASQRTAFGRPIGSFQAIKHRLADCYLAVEKASISFPSGRASTTTGSPARGRSGSHRAVAARGSVRRTRERVPRRPSIARFDCRSIFVEQRHEARRPEWSVWPSRRVYGSQC